MDILYASWAVQFGIPAGIIPKDRTEFQIYFAQEVEEIITLHEQWQQQNQDGDIETSLGINDHPSVVIARNMQRVAAMQAVEEGFGASTPPSNCNSSDSDSDSNRNSNTASTANDNSSSKSGFSFQKQSFALIARGAAPMLAYYRDFNLAAMCIPCTENWHNPSRR